MFNITFCAYCVLAKKSSSSALYIDILSLHCISVCCSQAVLVDRTVYILGQLGMDPSSGQLVPGGVAAEAKQALTNMGEILKAAGCDFTNVVKTTVLLADINDFNTVNEIYKQYFKNNFPARAAYQVAALPKGGRVEIEAVAVRGPLTAAAL
ncbi:2-iminobutanoate/2-iminopropanoate deaminase-like [Sturnira hondurensis]|uniref:2-iminobutanoate/2-iminopropanoate deaminase-like n=1 Tax=Sturnira hondurensis TaxID=192404 RepID=UPI001879E39A|nr:2-iminobutanoate/2-iminopropanoate deaminase-like [Sturnira hondurensis]